MDTDRILDRAGASSVVVDENLATSVGDVEATIPNHEETSDNAQIEAIGASVLRSLGQSGKHHDDSDDRPSGQWVILTCVVLATFTSLSTWFSTNSIASALEKEKELSDSQVAALSAVVQAGFVIGTAGMSLSNVADLVNARYLFAGCAVTAAVLNACIIPAQSFWLLVLIRIAAGVCFAGIYPPALKVLSGWYVEGRGYAMGCAVGALTMGSGSPFLLRSVFTENWQAVIWLSSGLSLLGAVVMAFLVSDGPHTKPPSSFEPRALLSMVQELPLALAVVGYLCHQWELYAFWSWVGPFLADRLSEWDGEDEEGGGGLAVSALVAFFAFAVGALLCPVAGAWADTTGRTVITTVSLLLSGTTALWLGWVDGGSEGGRVGVVIGTLLYGATIIPDSAQYSACVSELCDPRYQGTILTASTGLGFAVTIITIQLLPVVEDAQGWGPAWLMLGVPPLLGAGAMLWLRQLPESAKLAGGNK